MPMISSKIRYTACLAVFFILMVSALPSNAQSSTDCGGKAKSDRFRAFYCEECRNNTFEMTEYRNKAFKYKINLPSNYKIIEYTKDNRLFAYDPNVAQNLQSFSITVIDTRYHPTFDAYFVEYVNYFNNFILDEGEFFSYGIFQTDAKEAKYLFHEYQNNGKDVFSLKIFIHAERKVFIIDFAGLQNNYFDILCKYLWIVYSFRDSQNF